MYGIYFENCERLFNQSVATVMTAEADEIEQYQAQCSKYITEALRLKQSANLRTVSAELDGELVLSHKRLNGDFLRGEEEKEDFS